MFRIVYSPRHKNTHYGNYQSLEGIILAARDNGALVYEWDARSKVWREI